MDDDLRNGLWNAFVLYYLIRIGSLYKITQSHPKEIVDMWADFFKKPIDAIGITWHDTYEKIREYFFSCEWHEVYDFMEFIYITTRNNEFIDYCNNILERELSAYRIVGGRIVQITSAEEISEIEEALEATGSIKPVFHHLKTALDLLSDRKSPDYRNSIKESISAVEAICNLISKGNKIALGQALKEIEKKVELHPALKKAFDSLYGYSSNAEGIRYALLDEPNLDFEDTKFMLVSCSAFINYLITKSSKARIKL